MVCFSLTDVEFYFPLKSLILKVYTLMGVQGAVCKCMVYVQNFGITSSFLLFIASSCFVTTDTSDTESARAQTETFVLCFCFFNSQVTQEISDPSRVFRLLGSDRLVTVHFHVKLSYCTYKMIKQSRGNFIILESEA